MSPPLNRIMNNSPTSATTMDNLIWEKHYAPFFVHKKTKSIINIDNNIACVNARAMFGLLLILCMTEI